MGFTNVRLYLAPKAYLAKERLKLPSQSEIQRAQMGTLPTALDQESPSEKRKVCLEILSKSDYPYQLLQTQIQPRRQRPGFKGYKVVVGKNVNNIKHPLQPEVPLAENCKALIKN